MRCPNCCKSFHVPEDEQWDHECVYCGLFWADNLYNDEDMEDEE